MRKPLALGVLLVLSYVFVQTPHTVFACSGGVELSLNLEEVIGYTDVIVYATVVYVDDGGSGVLFAHYYLAGEYRPQYLMLDDTNHSLMAVIDRGYDLGCFFSYDLNPHVQMHMTGYFTLTRSPDGTYHYSNQAGPGFISNSSVEETANFESLVTEIRGGERLVADGSRQYPMYAPLNIKTDAGYSYTFPVDFGEISGLPQASAQPDMYAYSYPHIFNPMSACAEVECRMSMPDLSLFGDVLVDGLAFDYPYSSDASRNPDGERVTPIRLEGNAFSFAPNNIGLVTWEGYVMRVYRITNNFCPCLHSGSVSPFLQLIAEVELAPSWYDDTEVFSNPWEHVRWSADGTTLVYGDLEGLWLLDILRDGEPEQLVYATGGQLSLPVFASTAGRYIGYRLGEDSTDWQVIDRTDNRVYQNALPSPDEVYMAYFLEPGGRIAPRGDVLGAECLQLPCSKVLSKNVSYFSWIENQDGLHAAVVYCPEPDSGQRSSRDCEFYQEPFTYLNFDDHSRQLSFPEFRGVAHQERNGDIALATGEQSIAVNGIQFDLTGQIEGNIISVSWYRSVFYERN